MGIEFDLFYRTSSPENVALVQHFFKKLYKNGYIYPGRLDQFYCEYDRKFLPDRYVKGTCPFCGAEDQYSDGCENCGRTLQPGRYCIPVLHLRRRHPSRRRAALLLQALGFSDEARGSGWTRTRTSNPNRRNYVLNWIKEGLQDWDITRDITGA